MQLHCRFVDKQITKCDLLVLIVPAEEPVDFKDFSVRTDINLKNILSKLKLTGNGDAYFISLDNKIIPNLLLLRLAESGENPLERYREAGFSVQEFSQKLKNRNIKILFNNIRTDYSLAVRSVTEGLLLSEYQYLEFKTSPSESHPTKTNLTFLLSRKDSLPDMHRMLKKTAVIIEGVNTTRTFVNRPANILTPGKMASEIQKLFKGIPHIQVDVMKDKKLEKLGMNAFLSVAKGSSQKPVFVLMHYTCGIRNAPKLALLGKGITFDSGGISIKPAEGMEEMKYDMAGAAAVIGLFQIIKDLKPKIDVIGAIPAAENALGGNAYRPGDIIRSYTGKTIEIINTDAEGRLILADALAYVEKNYQPDWMVDIATLTGSIVTALGDQCCGIFSRNELLLRAFKNAAEVSGERVWAMPMWEAYKKSLESKVADVKHVGGRQAGSITAAKFLEHFVTSTPWLHMDIAGTAYNVKSNKYLSEGASGYGVRLIWEVINNLQSYN